MSPLDRFAIDLLADSLAGGERIYWERRAEQFEQARPRVGDYPGRTTLEERRQHYRDLTEVAKACRARATISTDLEQRRTEAAQVWGEAS
ncbi:hypothetical protein GCM10027425_33880 [Alteromonas gracilis]